MTRNEAREYFKSKGLTYAHINEEDVSRLTNLLSEELTDYKKNGGEHAEQMALTVSKLRKKDIKVLKRTGLQYARIQVDGSYFNRREAITFSQTGFIGFGGELDSKNVAPILKAFCSWCDTLSEVIKEENVYPEE